MLPPFDFSANGIKKNKIFLFCRTKRKLSEMRDNPIQQVINASHLKLEGFISIIPSYESTPKVLLHKVKHFAPVIVLTYRKTWLYFPTYLDIYGTIREGYTETSFTIGITGNIIRGIIQRHRIIACHYKIIVTNTLSLSPPTSGDDSSRYRSGKLLLLFPRYFPIFTIQPLSWTPMRASPFLDGFATALASGTGIFLTRHTLLLHSATKAEVTKYITINVFGGLARAKLCMSPCSSGHIMPRC